MSTERQARQSWPQEAPKRGARRRELTQIAAAMMNRDGAAAVTPAALAARTGMTRNALYYYYRDKESLLYSCYLAAAEHLLSVAEALLRVPGPPRERLRHLVDELLSPQVELAILHDLDLLPTEAAGTLRALQTQALVSVAAIFDDGVRDGSFRPIPTLTAAHVLLGMVDWARLWQIWVAPEHAVGERAAEFATAASTAIADNLLHGFATQASPMRAPPDVSALIGEAIDVLDRDAIGEQKRLALLGVASGLFNRRGIDATSIDDIARAADATKGLVYHHFKSKAALVDACYDRAFDLYERFAEVAENAAGAGALESLAWPMHFCTQALLSRTPPLILQAGVSALSPRHRRRAMALARRFRASMAVAADSGIAGATSLGFIDVSSGTFFWIPRWYDEAARIGAYTLGDQIVDLLVRGVLRG